MILDEVDQLHDTSVLYELYSTRGLLIVLIANDECKFLARLDSRLISRLKTSARIPFTSYTTTELETILTDRVHWSLHENVLTDDQLTTIAETAEGDARVAIGILRAAARRATQDGRETITDDVIEIAIADAKSELTQKTIEKLTPDQHTLYEILTEHGKLTPSELYSHYVEQADSPKTKRMVRNYLTKLCHYNLVVAEGENRGRTYRPV